MKNFYIAVSIDENGKKYAHIMKVNTHENLVNRLNTIRPEIAQICTTKKEAVQHVQHWNACYIANGEHLFDNPQPTTNTPETPENLRVCERCLCAIESREGQQITRRIYLDDDDPTPCDWCEEPHNGVLYEIL